MKFFAKTITVSNEQIIDSIYTHPSSNAIPGWTKLSDTQFNLPSGKVVIDTSVIPYEDLVKYCYNFKVNNGIVQFKTGINASTYMTTGKLQSLDMSVPFSFTRANTIVNFGRL